MTEIPGLIAPWLLYLFALCLCVVVFALARQARTLLWAPCVLLTLPAAALWQALCFVSDQTLLEEFLLPRLLYPWLYYTRCALPLCAICSTLLYCLRKRKARPLAAVLMVACLLVVSCLTPHAYFPALFRSNSTNPNLHLQQRLPTPAYRSWYSHDIDWTQELSAAFPPACIWLTEPVEIYADADAQSELVGRVPVGCPVYFGDMMWTTATVAPGWRCVVWPSWLSDHIVPAQSNPGYVQTDTLLQIIKTSDAAVLTRLFAREYLFEMDFHAWCEGRYLTADVVSYYPPFAQYCAAGTLAVCLIAWLRQRMLVFPSKQTESIF